LGLHFRILAKNIGLLTTLVCLNVEFVTNSASADDGASFASKHMLRPVCYYAEES